MKIAAPLTKNILLPFELSEPASAAETENHKKNKWSRSNSSHIN